MKILSDNGKFSIFKSLIEVMKNTCNAVNSMKHIRKPTRLSVLSSVTDNQHGGCFG